MQLLTYITFYLGFSHRRFEVIYCWAWDLLFYFDRSIWSPTCWRTYWNWLKLSLLSWPLGPCSVEARENVWWIWLIWFISIAIFSSNWVNVCFQQKNRLLLACISALLTNFLIILMTYRILYLWLKVCWLTFYPKFVNKIGWILSDSISCSLLAFL